MAVKQISAESAVTPNLVPMVDIMFLLLLFLMVGADMGNRELEDVRLPLAKSAIEEKKEPSDDRLTLNVYHSHDGCPAYEGAQLCVDPSHWVVGIRGEDYKEEGKLQAFLEGLAKEDCARNQSELPQLHVLVRADKAALFGEVQRAMFCCAQARILKVELAAATGVE
jgi:biopolymer transport protein ExbD